MILNFRSNLRISLQLLLGKDDFYLPHNKLPIFQKSNSVTFQFGMLIAVSLIASSSLRQSELLCTSINFNVQADRCESMLLNDSKLPRSPRQFPRVTSLYKECTRVSLGTSSNLQNVRHRFLGCARRVW